MACWGPRSPETRLSATSPARGVWPTTYDGDRGKIGQPVASVGKFVDLLVRYAHGLHDAPLVHLLAGLGSDFALLLACTLRQDGQSPSAAALAHRADSSTGQGRAKRKKKKIGRAFLNDLDGSFKPPASAAAGTAGAATASPSPSPSAASPSVVASVERPRVHRLGRQPRHGVRHGPPPLCQRR